MESMWGIVLLIVVVLILLSVCNRSKEGFNPYRCGRTGMNYLDVYDQEDYYAENPYGYPNPESYTTAWYKLRGVYGPE